MSNQEQVLTTRQAMSPLIDKQVSGEGNTYDEKATQRRMRLCGFLL